MKELVAKLQELKAAQGAAPKAEPKAEPKAAPKAAPAPVANGGDDVDAAIAELGCSDHEISGHCAKQWLSFGFGFLI